MAAYLCRLIDFLALLRALGDFLAPLRVLVDLRTVFFPLPAALFRFVVGISTISFDYH